MGVVEGITLVLDATGATRTVDAVDAEAGRGLDGDYHSDLTLITAEALDGLREDTGIELSGEQSRRNLLTRGIDLNALVGQRFKVGGVEAVGVDPDFEDGETAYEGVVQFAGDGGVGHGPAQVVHVAGGSGAIQTGDLLRDVLFQADHLQLR